MTYSEQLETPEWKAKRKEVLERDQNRCTSCKRPPSVFNKITSGKQSFRSLNQLKEEGFSVEIPETLSEITLKKGTIVFQAKPLFGPYSKPDISELLFTIQYSTPSNPFMFVARSYVFFHRKDFDNDPKVVLCVHHTRYKESAFAWEYPLEQLITLCMDCHHQLHKSINIPIYSSNDQLLGYSKLCDRCDGYGFLHEYDYVLNGICFKCWGKGDVIEL